MDHVLIARASRILSAVGISIGLFLISAGIFSLLGGKSFEGVWYILSGWFVKQASAARYQKLRLDEAL